MKKTIFTVLLMTAVVTPQIVSAAWWNPISWNWKALFTTPNSTQVDTKNLNVEVVDESATSVPEQEVVLKNESQPSSAGVITTPVSKSPIVQPVKVVSSGDITQTPTFLIQNVKNEVTKDLVKITWTTSIDSQSQLLMDNGEGIGYESMGGFGKSHYITLDDPVPSKEHFYKIVARSSDGKIVDYYGSFTAIREFVFTTFVRNNCQVVSVQDTAGKPAVGMAIKITGTYGLRNTNVGIPWMQETTNRNGEVELSDYCNINSFRSLRVKMDDGFETKLQIQNGTGVGSSA